jgi:hypothetical protein
MANFDLKQFVIGILILAVVVSGSLTFANELFNNYGTDKTGINDTFANLSAQVSPTISQMDNNSKNIQSMLTSRKSDNIITDMYTAAYTVVTSVWDSLGLAKTILGGIWATLSVYGIPGYLLGIAVAALITIIAFTIVYLIFFRVRV